MDVELRAEQGQQQHGLTGKRMYLPEESSLATHPVDRAAMDSTPLESPPPRKNRKGPAPPPPIIHVPGEGVGTSDQASTEPTAHPAPPGDGESSASNVMDNKGQEDPEHLQDEEQSEHSYNPMDAGNWQSAEDVAPPAAQYHSPRRSDPSPPPVEIPETNWDEPQSGHRHLLAERPHAHVDDYPAPRETIEAKPGRQSFQIPTSLDDAEGI